MRVSSLVLIPFTGLFVLVLLAPSRGALAQSADFAISQNGKPVGTASFNIVSRPSGFDSSSVLRVEMQGLNYALSKTEELSSSRSLVHVQLSAIINGSAVNVEANPDAEQLLVNISANGTISTVRLAFHKSAVFLPDFDPGGLENLLATAAANHNRDLWAIIPKQAGSIAPIQLATYPDERGTLNNNLIEVHHLVATIAGAATDLFSDPDNQLLQAELPQDGFALVRKGFVLTPPAKPLTLPAAAPSGATQ
jgi:hypothetical protein